MRRSFLADRELQTTDEAFQELRVDDLKSLARLLGKNVPARKAELVALLTKTMRNEKAVRELYEQLDDTGKAAIQEAAHDEQGSWHGERFHAKYGREPSFGKTQFSYRSPAQPTPLWLFMPNFTTLPLDLRALLLTFVPEPKSLEITGTEEQPTAIRQTYHAWEDGKQKEIEEEVPLRVRQTAREALHDVKAVLRLVDAGEVRVSDKTRRPTQAAMKAVRRVLAGGDFYSEEEQSTDKYEEVSKDLAIKSFAWPLVLQAAGLAELAGTRLQLTDAGRKATLTPPEETIRKIWNKWRGTDLLDEFNRVTVIKGQQSRGALTAVAPRRQAVSDVLANCPARKWIAIDEFFRLCQASGSNITVARDKWKLYTNDAHYGSFGYEGSSWSELQGRYILALLFEYAATLGLIDVAYIAPESARPDFHDRWGTDDLSCLSRYDGLMYLCINPLGAWCLRITDRYEAEVVTVAPVLRVLPNLDVVASDHRPEPADALFLDRLLEKQADAVWQLRAPKILAAVEEGLTVQELIDFLIAKSSEPLPQTVQVFLDDLKRRAGQLRDSGMARMVECEDDNVAQLLLHDRRLRELCQLAGERCLVFRSGDEAAVRRGFRELGYVLPPQR